MNPDIERLTPHERAALQLVWADIRRWPCDYCGAGYGELCANRITGEPFGHGPGHHSRIALAARGAA